MLRAERQVEMEQLIGRAEFSAGATGPVFILRSISLAHRGLGSSFFSQWTQPEMGQQDGAGEILHVQTRGAQWMGLRAELQRPSIQGLCSDWNNKCLLKLYTIPIFMLRAGGSGNVN